MITIIEGDLLKSTEDIIGHQVNCRGRQGSGVALQLKNKYPEQYKKYIHLYNAVEDKEKLLGHCQIILVDKNKYVANLFGQYDYGYDGKIYTEVNALKKSLINLKDRAANQNKSIALPYKIGSDRGGANWEEIYGIIEEVFKDYEVTLYKYNGGKK